MKHNNMINLSNPSLLPKELVILYEENKSEPKHKELIKAYLENQRFIVLHTTCVKSKEQILKYGLKRNSEQNYMDNMTFFLNTLSEAEKEEAKQLLLDELKRKNSMTVPKVYVFCCEDDLKDERCAYYVYCDNIGGEIAFGAFKNKPEILNRLSDGERIIVKAGVPFSYFADKDVIVDRVVKMLKSSNSSMPNESFDTELICDILPEDIIEISEAVLWEKM